MEYNHPVETTYNIFELLNDRGVLEIKKTDLTTKDEAVEWLSQNATPKHYYVILQTYRRQ
jgi:hypothetical protein